MGLREENKASQMVKIAMAAKTILKEDGLETLEMKAISRVASISSKTCYNHFENKGEVLFSLLLIELNPFSEKALALMLGDDLFQVNSIIEIFEDIILTDEIYYKNLLSGVYSLYPALKREESQGVILFALADSFERFKKLGKIKKRSDPVMLSRLVLHLMNGILREWTDNGKTFEETSLVAKYTYATILSDNTTTASNKSALTNANRLRKKLFQLEQLGLS